MEIHERQRKALRTLWFLKRKRYLVECLASILEQMCYAGTSVKGIREGYAIGEVCRRLQAMQAITW